MTRAERIAALELEAQRLKARLDVLDAQIAGDHDAWLGITLKMGGEVAEVFVDKVLSEARQHALAYATVCKTLDALAGKTDEAGPAVDVADEMKQRREAKLARARTHAL